MRKNRLINIGKHRFIQYTNFPYTWGTKVVTRGWTQESEEPYRSAKPFILRLPSYKALVFGKWTGVKEQKEVEELLGIREVTYDDFKEEAGWVPAPDESGEESLEDLYARINNVDGAVYAYDWSTYYNLAKGAE